MPISRRLMMMKKLRLLTSHRWYLFLIVMRKCMYLTQITSMIVPCIFFLNGFCICRFFDRDIECIYKFFNKRFVVYARKFQLILIWYWIIFFIEISILPVRFNLTSEKEEEQDGSESDVEGNSRPSFLSVKKAAGSLDKELAASGFTRKEQVEMDKVGQMFRQICYSCIYL